MNLEEIDKVLAALVFSEMITVTNLAGYRSFRIQPLGEFAVTVLSHNNTYVEQVCQKTSVPELIKENLTCYKLDERSENTIEWYKDCIVNTFVFLQYLRYVEDLEYRNATQQGGQERDVTAVCDLNREFG